jgi:hypothetical protein
MLGAGRYVKRESRVLVPRLADTPTSTDPDPTGLTAVISVELTLRKLTAGVEPKSTAVTVVKFVPVIVTVVPPVEGPDSGVRDVTVGAPM